MTIFGFNISFCFVTGFEPPPAKKVATVRSASPFRNKENKQPYKKNIGTMGTSSRFPSAKSSFFPKKPIG